MARAMSKAVAAFAFSLVWCVNCYGSAFGWHDFTSTAGVAGWTCDPANFAAIISIRVQDQFGLVGIGSAGDFRGDVGNAGVCGGTSSHGFNYPFSSSSRNLRDGQTHQFSVYGIGIDGSATLLSGSPQSLFMSADVAAYGWEDAATSDFVYGWTCDTDNVNASLAIRISDQSGVIGFGTASIPRGDLVNVCPGNVNHGYQFFWTQAQRNVRDNQFHQITVEAQDAETGLWIALSGSPQTTFIPGAASTFTVSGHTGSPGSIVNAGSLSTTADSTGFYTLAGLPTGSYVISATATGARCSVVPATITVSVGPNATANFETQCERSADPLMASNTASHYRQCDENGSCIYCEGASCNPFGPSVRPSWAFSNSNEVPIPPNSFTQPVASLPNNLVDAFFTKVMLPRNDGSNRNKAVLGMNKDSQPTNTSDNNILLNVRPGSALSDPQVWFSTTYATAFVEDNFDVNGNAPTLGEDLWADLRAHLVSHAVSIDPPTYTPLGPMAGFPAVPGMSRLTVGITATWGGLPHTVEIVLWRDSAYDGCDAGSATWWGPPPQSPCDSSGLYERRVFYTSGELVYFDAPALGQVYSQIPDLAQTPTPLPLGVGGTNAYSLPVTKLFQWYFGTGRSVLGAPVNWQDAVVHGVYLGIEMWGKARTNVEIYDYRLYARKH